MDSITVLDYALFQLTPTRTRCDLAIFAGKKYEKIASGLLEPYLSNLRSAKDQFSKGGYSITLRPEDSDSSSWLTKSTLERFVRFVETPEVLERFVTIEREIKQIDRSIESNEQVNGDHSNPKVQLQSALESRKVVLKKEQAMAYARAIVMGFDTDSLYHLVSFSDAFGAMRLRDACMNFIELCHKKNDDSLWMKEVALMQESYNDSNPNHGTYNGTEDQVREKTLTWVNNHPQHYAPQGSMYQQFPPYHGYLLHGSGYFPGKVLWPGNYPDSTAVLYDRDSKERKRDKDSKHKYAPKNHLESETDDDDDDSVSSDELSRKNKKSSRRKVVVRNVNYYNVDADLSDEDHDDGRIDSDLIKQKVDDDNVNVDKGAREGEKKYLNWNIFENLLMKSSSDTKDREEHSSAKHVSDECGTEETKDRSSVFEDLQHGVVRKNIECYEELLIPPTRIEEEYKIESSVTNYQKEDDLFIGNYKTEISEEMDRAVLCNDQENVLESSRHKVEGSNFDEPEDLYMVIQRDSAAPEQVVQSWNPEMDLIESTEDKSRLEMVQIQNKKEEDDTRKKRPPSTKPVSKINPKMKSKSDAVPSRSKVSSTVSRKMKIEADKEEEKRKKLEELKIQRQKRIAERTAARAAIVPNPKEMIKKNVVPKKTEKITKKPESPSDRIKKPVMSNSTINRLSTTARASSTKSRVLVQNEKPASKKSNVPKTTTSKTVKGTQEKVNAPSLKRAVTTSVPNKSKARSDDATALVHRNNKSSEDNEDIVKVLHTVISVEKTTPDESSYSTKIDRSKDASPDDHDKVIMEEPSKQIEMQHRIEDRVVTFDPLIKGNDAKLPIGKNGDNNQKKKLTFSPEISVVHIISTPPDNNPVIESKEEVDRSRKKWSVYGGDGSAKAPKGFRKLLFFGRRI